MAWPTEREVQDSQGYIVRLCLKTTSCWWWHRPLIPALGRQRQVDLCEFEFSLVYKN